MEVFECFNHIFRMCSVLSNHQAPGHDIARKCASMERVKHTTSGGYWEDTDGTWVQASSHVRSMLLHHPIIQTHLGWAPPAQTVSGASFFWMSRLMNTGPLTSPTFLGAVQALPCDKQQALWWSETCGPRAASCSDVLLPPESEWCEGVHVMAISGNICPIGAWVFAEHDVVCP
jgi:hypothetical protein